MRPIALRSRLRRWPAITAGRLRHLTAFHFNVHDLLLLVNLTNMALRDRFLGSAAGRVWAILNPLLLMLIFAYVFTFVFRSRLPGSDSSLAYIIWLFSGYGPWLAISEGIMTATHAVVGNSGLVKNLSFKTELLPMAASLLGLVPLLVTFALLIILLAFDGRYPSWPWLILLPVICLQFMMVTGIGLFVSALNVFVRDVGLLLPNILVMVLFLSPIFYSVESYPQAIRFWLKFNPFYLVSEGYRQPLIHNAVPPLWQLALLTATSIGCFAGGLAYFRRLKGYFDAKL
jgi:ABC-type polysaccharide/polyol phosphate export permease